MFQRTLTGLYRVHKSFRGVRGVHVCSDSWRLDEEEGKASDALVERILDLHKSTQTTGKEKELHLEHALENDFLDAGLVLLPVVLHRKKSNLEYPSINPTVMYTFLERLSAQGDPVDASKALQVAEKLGFPSMIDHEKKVVERMSDKLLACLDQVQMETVLEVHRIRGPFHIFHPFGNSELSNRALAAKDASPEIAADEEKLILEEMNERKRLWRKAKPEDYLLIRFDSESARNIRGMSSHVLRTNLFASKDVIHTSAFIAEDILADMCKTLYAKRRGDWELLSDVLFSAGVAFVFSLSPGTALSKLPRNEHFNDKTNRRFLTRKAEMTNFEAGQERNISKMRNLLNSFLDPKSPIDSLNPLKWDKADVDKLAEENEADFEWTMQDNSYKPEGSIVTPFPWMVSDEAIRLRIAMYAAMMLSFKRLLSLVGHLETTFATEHFNSALGDFSESYLDSSAAEFNLTSEERATPGRFFHVRFLERYLITVESERALYSELACHLRNQSFFQDLPLYPKRENKCGRPEASALSRELLEEVHTRVQMAGELFSMNQSVEFNYMLSLMRGSAFSEKWWQKLEVKLTEEKFSLNVAEKKARDAFVFLKMQEMIKECGDAGINDLPLIARETLKPQSEELKKLGRLNDLLAYQTDCQLHESLNVLSDDILVEFGLDEEEEVEDSHQKSPQDEEAVVKRRVKSPAKKRKRPYKKRK